MDNSKNEVKKLVNIKMINKNFFEYIETDKGKYLKQLEFNFVEIEPIPGEKKWHNYKPLFSSKDLKNYDNIKERIKKNSYESILLHGNKYVIKILPEKFIKYTVEEYKHKKTEKKQKKSERDISAFFKRLFALIYQIIMWFTGKSNKKAQKNTSKQKEDLEIKCSEDVEVTEKIQKYFIREKEGGEKKECKILEYYNNNNIIFYRIAPNKREKDN